MNLYIFGESLILSDTLAQCIKACQGMHRAYPKSGRGLVPGVRDLDIHWMRNMADQDILFCLDSPGRDFRCVLTLTAGSGWQQSGWLWPERSKRRERMMITYQADLCFRYPNTDALKNAS
jgi:hypothetical protein